MKTLRQWTWALVALVAVANWNGVVNAQMFPGGTEEDATLTIHPDGSCRYVSKTVESRALAEQQVRMMERFKEMSETAGGGQDDSMMMTNQTATNVVTAS